MKRKQDEAGTLEDSNIPEVDKQAGVSKGTRKRCRTEVSWKQRKKIISRRDGFVGINT